MTVEQADDINNLFVTYNDRIKVLNDIIWRQNYDVKFLEKKNDAKDLAITSYKEILETRDKQITIYKKRIKEVEKLEYIDKKTRKRVTWGIIGSAVMWTGIAISLVIKG
jgi:hypothetical protein